MNADERKITEELIRQLGNDYIFKSLNNASFLYDIDETIKENYGLTFYAGITGGRSLLKTLNPNQFGIEHTGILGDVYGGSFSVHPVYEKPYIMDKQRFTHLLDIDIKTDFLNEFAENELLWFYTRGLLGAVTTHLIRQNYFETYSPFEDIEVLELMFKIPLEKRITDRIYVKWLEKKYPEAVKVKYAQTLCKPTSSKWKIKCMAAWKIAYFKVILPILHKFNSKIELNYRGTMNPVDYWCNTNETLANFIEQYFQNTIELVDNVEIKENLYTMHNEGNAVDKMIMLTVLGVYNVYFK